MSLTRVNSSFLMHKTQTLTQNEQRPEDRKHARTHTHTHAHARTRTHTDRKCCCEFDVFALALSPSDQSPRPLSCSPGLLFSHSNSCHHLQITELLASDLQHLVSVLSAERRETICLNSKKLESKFSW